METITHSEEETALLGEALAKKLRPGDVLALYGDLGAGKTALTRGIARGLGLKARVSSPTFTIVNEYLGPIPLFHFDMYRLHSADELFEIGWEDYLSRGGVCCVEWSENVPGAFPPGHLTVTIEKNGEQERKITIKREGGGAL
ncbi:MAG: tRNA (adenosine(37)-N6)-threonylcarbamoyltransferase complex ATPase subunit type 1 TsaE [bacterium]